ncbi:unnamed protein product [Oncorhynchus mykiss]|uniref:Laminin G domain-containing protein n=1 Tax=Oncorhynchus mykiss TaxID=8022 RepID=A0A060ZI51_ONCMY|nr:unnamed protein product [Oncorhynchus mykiss]
MKVHGIVAFKCENVATLDPITFETPGSFITLNKWNAKKTGSISFDFRTTEPNGLLLFSHGKPKQAPKDSKSPLTLKVDFFAIEMLDGHLYLLLDMGSGTTKTRAINKKVNDGEWYHVDFQRDGRSGNSILFCCYWCDGFWRRPWCFFNPPKGFLPSLPLCVDIVGILSDN